MSEGNVDLARRGFSAAARGDFEAIGELLDPEVKWHGGDPAWSGACHNRDETLTFMRRGREQGRLPELVDVIDCGEQVVVVLQPPGTEERRANLTTFRDGKVVEMVAFDSPEAALAAARGT